MTRYALPDGSEIDTEEVLSTHPTVLSVTHPYLAPEQQPETVLDAQFAGSSLPDWLTYVTDNGPGSPTFGGLTDRSITLSTGATSSGDVSVVQTDAINWDTVSELHIFTEWASSSGAEYISYGDNKDPSQLTEGVKLDHTSDLFARVVTGGSGQNNAKFSSAVDRFGVSIQERGSEGHTLRFYANGRIMTAWSESMGWPAAGQYPISVGVRTTDGTDATATLERLLVLVD